MESIVIEINGLAVRARHGVFPQERAVGNDFEVDLRIEYPAREAVDHDRLDATLNYAEAAAVVREVMSVPSQLLENVCGRLRVALMERFPAIIAGRVRVAKLNPPIAGAQLRSVAVELSWNTET